MNPMVREKFTAYAVPLSILICTWVVVTSMSPNFRGSASAYSVLEGSTLLGLVALGLGVTIIVGELDLSVGSMAAVAGVIAVLCAPMGLLPAIVIPVLCGIAFGMLQGYVIVKFRINSLVLTIGTLILLRGVAYMLSGNAPLPLSDYTVSDPMLERFGIFSIASIIALFILTVLGMFLTYTKWGREIYAIGGAAQEAVTAGVPKIRPITISFAISAGCASLAGAMATIRGGSAAPENYSGLLLAAAAAALLGGVSLYGGRGTVINVFIGSAILSLIASGLAVRGSDAATVQLVTGTLLLIAIFLELGIARYARVGKSTPKFLRRRSSLRPKQPAITVQFREDS